MLNIKAFSKPHQRRILQTIEHVFFFNRGLQLNKHNENFRTSESVVNIARQITQ